MSRTPSAPRRPTRDRSPLVRWGQDAVTRANRAAFARVPPGTPFTYEHAQGRASRTADTYRLLAFAQATGAMGFVVRLHFDMDPVPSRFFRLRDVGEGMILAAQNPDGAVRPWRAPLAGEEVFASEVEARRWAEEHAAWRREHPGMPSEVLALAGRGSFWERLGHFVGLAAVGDGRDE